MLKCLIKLKFRKTYYLIEYINIVNPKLIITYTDNDIFFYKLKNLLKEKIVTIAIQNGIRTLTGDILGILRNSQEKIKLSSDWIITFNDRIGLELKKFISTNTLSIGSIRNNFNPISFSKNKIKGSILLISQYVSSSPVEDKKLVLHLFQFLMDYAKKNNKTLGVLTRGQRDEEISFFKKHGKNQFHFVKKNFQNSYHWIDKYEVTVSIDSTLGLEALSRGNKAAFFYVRSKFRNVEGRKFGWPDVYPDQGFAWTHLKDNQCFENILDKQFNTTHQEWQKILSDNEFNKIMFYDEGNKIIKKFFKNIYSELNI